MMETFRVNPYTPKPHLRNQTSLELLLDLQPKALPSDISQISRAKELYDVILTTYRKSKRGRVQVSTPMKKPSASFQDGFMPHRLLKYLYIYSPTLAGKENILQQFLRYVFQETNHNEDDKTLEELDSLESIVAHGWNSWSAIDSNEDLLDRVELFAIHLLQAFFLPLKSNGHQTPVALSIITPYEGSEVAPEQTVIGRLKGLRERCMIRDGYKCVVSGMVDYSEADRRFNLNQKLQMKLKEKQHDHGESEHEGTTSDEDEPGTVRSDEDDDEDIAVTIEAAHIIPHSLNASSGSCLSDEKKYIWRVINMFNPGINQIVAGDNIDKPHNAISLAQELHSRFGNLKCYFEEIEGGPPNTYFFKSVPRARRLAPCFWSKSKYITFKNHDENTLVALPDPQLLRFHRACALILSLSGAGEYIERLLDDVEKLKATGQFAGDGTSDLTSYFSSRGLFPVSVC